MSESVHETDRPLSAEGVARRAAMLDELTAVMEQTHQRRRVRRRFVAACGWAVLATSAVIAARSQMPGAGGARSIDEPGDAAVATVVNVEIVETDASVLDRWRPVATFSARFIDDDTLLTELARLDRPTGIVRSEGRTWLTAAVTDDELESESF